MKILGYAQLIHVQTHGCDLEQSRIAVLLLGTVPARRQAPARVVLRAARPAARAVAEVPPQPHVGPGIGAAGALAGLWRDLEESHNAHAPLVLGPRILRVVEREHDVHAEDPGQPAALLPGARFRRRRQARDQAPHQVREARVRPDDVDRDALVHVAGRRARPPGAVAHGQAAARPLLPVGALARAGQVLRLPLLERPAQPVALARAASERGAPGPRGGASGLRAVERAGEPARQGHRIRGHDVRPRGLALPALQGDLLLDHGAVPPPARR
mmetsp:Transcript_49922/g.142689  ORF Transcript_49922/g.142689 Transcript_49922/m.142689 type:complete len:271 (-) Transcript_49922:383-1195(-)